ncbi:MAG: cupin domain-containing protein [Rhodospirillaceae bacterium]
MKFPRPVDQAAVAANWAGRGYDCRPFTDPPGQRWEDFVHDCNELVTAVDGKLEMEIEGQRMEMGSGDEVFIPAKAVHSVRNIHGGTTRWLFGYD